LVKTSTVEDLASFKLLVLCSDEHITDSYDLFNILPLVNSQNCSSVWITCGIA